MPKEDTPPEQTSEVIAGLASGVSALQESVATLTQVVNGYDRSIVIENRVRRRANISILILVIVALAMGLYSMLTVSALHHTAALNRRTNQQNQQILKAIQDATGSAAQARQQQGLAAALEAIDQRQHTELQNAIDIIALLLGKSAPQLPATTSVVPSTTPTATTTPPSTVRRSSPTTTAAMPAPHHPTTTTTRPPLLTVPPAVCHLGVAC